MFSGVIEKYQSHGRVKMMMMLTKVRTLRILLTKLVIENMLCSTNLHLKMESSS